METTGLAERMAHIEGAFAQIDQRLGQVERDLSGIRGEIGSLRVAMVAMQDEIRSLYRMVIGVLIPMWVTIIGAIIAVALTR